jgi:acetylornithine deacetylase
VAYGSEASNFTDVQRLVVLGPGDICQAHKSDEWISLDQLEQRESVYRELLKQYCQ